MRIALVYDCLYPHTVGGAERWYRNLAEGLATAGHDVTYLTLRQWEQGERPAITGVRVNAVGPRMKLYSGGRRRILPPLVFGLGVFVHLLWRGRRYDVVHTASFPYFSLLAAAALRRPCRYRIFVDWIEIWTKDYWSEYLGGLGGRIGWWVQRLGVRSHHKAFALSELHARRLRELGYRRDVVVLGGLYSGSTVAPEVGEAEPVVVFAGRHIPEKQVPALVPALALTRVQVPELRGEIFGDGPDRDEVLRLIERHELGGVVDAPGFVEAGRLKDAIRRALCLVLPSTREGYGLVVVEAAALGTPSVVVQGQDNAATELVEDGVNGVIARSKSPEDLAEAILRVHRGGLELRRSTAAWFGRNAERLSVDSSVGRVLEAYA